MSITAEDWVALMPIVTDRGWRVVRYTSGRRVLRDRDGYCPICALADEAGVGSSRTDARLAALFLSGEPAGAGVEDVMEAADYADDPLRPALMQALGMTP